MARRYALIAGSRDDTFPDELKAQGNAVIERFRTVSTQLGFHFEPQILTWSQASERLAPPAQPDAAEQILLLVLAGSERRHTDSIAGAMHGPHSILPIVVVQGPLDGSRAMHLVHEFGALCVAGAEIEPDQFQSYSCAVAAGSHPFTNYFEKNLTLSSRIAFVITPYRAAADLDYWSGIRLGLGALQIRAIRASESMNRADLLENALNHISDCDLVLVNQTSYGESPNPNVYFEHGFAHGIAKKTIILVKAAPGQSLPEPPINLKGLYKLVYSSPGDLAQQLYFGLKHLVHAK